MKDGKTSEKSSGKAGATGSKNTKRPARGLERDGSRWEMLSPLLERISGSLDLDGICRLLVTGISDRLGAGRVSLYAARPDCEDFTHIYSLGHEGEDPPALLPAGGGFARWVRRSGEPVFIDRYFDTAGDIPPEEMSFLTDIGRLGYSYAYRLQSGGVDLGVLLFSGGGGERPSVDCESVRICAGVAAGAIRNALIHNGAERVRRSAEESAGSKREQMAADSRRLRESLSVLKSSMWSLDSDDPASSILVGMARDSVTSMESALDHLLALAEMDIAEPDLDLAGTELAHLVEDCMREYIAEFEEKGITVSVRDSSGGREVYLDRSRMMVALRTIVENAIRSVGRGGRIVVETYVSMDEPGENDGLELGNGPGGASREMGVELPFAVISIKDDGSGIMQEDVPGLSSPSGKSAGRCASGGIADLGLDVARSIVAGHGGKLMRGSGAGAGRVFSIWLPISH